MPGLAIAVGLIVVVALVVIYLRMRQGDQLKAIMDKHRNSAKLVSRAEYVEGAEVIPVALALTDDTFYYENADLEASFDLNRIDEIEYSDELMTGKRHDENTRVLRLRSHGTTFEYLIEKNESKKWEATLPPKTYDVARAV